MRKGLKRRLLGIALLASAGVIALGLISSRWWVLGWRRSSGGRDIHLSLYGGMLQLRTLATPTVPSVINPGFFSKRSPRPEGPRVLLDPLPDEGPIPEHQYQVPRLAYLSLIPGRETFALLALWPVPCTLAVIGAWSLRSGHRARLRPQPDGSAEGGDNPTAAAPSRPGTEPGAPPAASNGHAPNA